MLFEIEAPRLESDRRIEELEQVIGRLTVENEALKKHRAGWDGRLGQTDDGADDDTEIRFCERAMPAGGVGREQLSLPADGSFVYLAIVLDVFTRVIRGWALGKDITHELALAALNKALKKAVPHIHHSDQGVRPSTAWDVFNPKIHRYPVQPQYPNQHV